MKLCRVFPLSIFEVNEGQEIPKDKTTLTSMLSKNLAIPFHKRLCPSCHKVPKAEQWVKANETEGLIYLFCNNLLLVKGYNFHYF